MDIFEGHQENWTGFRSHFYGPLNLPTSVPIPEFRIHHEKFNACTLFMEYFEISRCHAPFNVVGRRKAGITEKPPTYFFLKLAALKKSSLGGLEPPAFRLTAEHANRLRHRDVGAKCQLIQLIPCLLTTWTQAGPIKRRTVRIGIQIIALCDGFPD